MASFRTLLFLCVCLMLISCGGDSQKQVSTDEESLFIEIYTQLSLAAQEHWDHPEELAAAQEMIFLQADVTREQYAALIGKMKASPERWAIIWERIVVRLEVTAEHSQETAAPQSL